MQLQDIIIKFSDIRPFQSSVLNKLSGNSTRWLMKKIGSFFLPLYFKMHSGVECYWKAKREGRTIEAVVSMTSFPQRIGIVWLVIECLLRQTRVPQKILLWLSADQFPTIQDIPESLKRYPEDILEINLVKGDIRSHKKYWYTIKRNYNTSVVLVDDDLMYDSHILEDLERAASKENKIISCCWGSRMSWRSDGSPKPYSEWANNKPSIREVVNDYFFGSGGGTYFPVGSLDGACQPIEDIMSVCPTADDIWLNAITRKNSYQTSLIRHQISVPEWEIRNNKKLSTINNGKHQNDKQLDQVRKYIIKTFGIDPFCLNCRHRNDI